MKRALIWMLCHYPNRRETAERVHRTRELVKHTNFPVWLFGSHVPAWGNMEELMKEELLKAQVPPERIVCSSEWGRYESLDTVSEFRNVCEEARKQSIENILCVSNRLQLLQVRALSRSEKNLNFFYCKTPLREKTASYLMARMILIPVCALGLTNAFVPLKALRFARSRLAYFRF